MPTDMQIRNRLLRRIQRIPADKLGELEDFMSTLEENASKKEKILSFAGAWKDMDESLFEDFTVNLIRNRRRNKRRTDE